MISKKSELIYASLSNLFPGGVNSPVRALKGANRAPLVLKAALQDQLIDVEGERFIDFCASWGALILGHADQGLIDTLSRALQRGTSYGVTHLYEAELAKKVIECMPIIEKLRFVSSGTEATMYALRLARGVTARDYIVKFIGNYHGCADFLLSEAGSGFATYKASSRGIPKEAVQYTLNLPYNDVEALEKLFDRREYKDKIAAVIVEPIAANMGCVLAQKKFLERLREVTEANKTLLIFDEVVTGFRLGRGGASEYYGIVPDLTCLGKIIGGGLPAAAYGGKREIMDELSPNGTIYQAGTLSGNPLAMAAGSYVLDQISQPDFYSNLHHKTNQFLAPIEDKLAKRGLGCIQKIGSMFTLFFGKERVLNMQDSEESNKELFWSFFNYLFDRGIYWSPSPYEACFMMQAHSQESLDKAQKNILDFLDQV